MNARDPNVPDTGGKGRERPFLACLAVIVSILEWSGRLIVSASFLALFVALLVNVVLRYAFGSGLAWAYELHAVLLPWLVGGGIVIAAARGRNIAIALVPEMMKPAARRYLLLAVNIVLLIVSVAVLWSSPPILKAAQFQSLSTLGIKQIWGYSSLVYAFAAMGSIALIDGLRLLGDRHQADRLPETTSLG